LAASESAADGAAAGCDPVFAVILGTGVGGGVACGGRALEGANGLAGEWGHNPLPWPRLAPAWGEVPGPRCWCGRHACAETFLSGPALAADYASQGPAARASGAPPRDATRVIEAMRAGDPQARAAFVRYCDRLARGLAQVINLLDPQAIVLGGGMSNVEELYAEVPARWPAWVFSPEPVRTRLLRARHGDSSGVRGAAWLWRERPGS
ncbi:MAG: ROK family protein, partial [Betaproteobacteria bacterium]|nr:ROK family protein [Betaproteobacteria bacterium]